MRQASEKKIPVKEKKTTEKKIVAEKLLVKKTKPTIKATVNKSAHQDIKTGVEKSPAKGQKANAKEMPTKKTLKPKTSRKKASPKVLEQNDVTLQMLQMIQKSLDADKAEEIKTIDLRGKTTIADYMVIANGGSSRQLVAMAEHVASKCKSEFKQNVLIEGKGESDWVLLDTGDIIVHLFRAEMRRFYNLEKMWEGELPTDMEDSLENQVLRHRARKKS